MNIDLDSLIHGIDNIYLSIVTNLFIPRHKRSFHKFWCTLELNVLKEMAMVSCRTWRDTGKPRHRNIFPQYKKISYCTKNEYEKNKLMRGSMFTNDLHDALLNNNYRQKLNSSN